VDSKIVAMKLTQLTVAADAKAFYTVAERPFLAGELSWFYVRVDQLYLLF
jgi:hypothetical protein